MVDHAFHGMNPTVRLLYWDFAECQASSVSFPNHVSNAVLHNIADEDAGRDSYV